MRRFAKVLGIVQGERTFPICSGDVAVLGSDCVIKGLLVKTKLFEK